MFDISSLNRRYFDICIGTLKLSIEPPKLKILRRLEKLFNINENKTEELINILSVILSKNKTGFKVSEDFIEQNFNTDEIAGLLEVYFNWLNETVNDPN